ncbi:CLC_0170 family protein [Paenibacillus germinis]|uniref:CLC_0170 family protein n=1 Tax=Paenibacillus germinis TaxID=2654979 RepID=UPI0035E43E09
MSFTTAARVRRGSTMITFNYYTVLLLLISGILILCFDVRIYVKTGMIKEKKGALITGWLSIALAFLSFCIYYIYEKWFWN